MLPRVLTLMGSGETSPTMVKVHRAILDRLGPRPVPTVLLDTPFGFQENADELSIRVRNYFQESLQTTISNASGIDPDHLDNADARFLNERLTSNIRHARYVFSGPGSPTYALKEWEGTVVPQLLAEKLTGGGAVTFASAAALTLGALTVPVYEIYKVGEEPSWRKGLDLLSTAGLDVAVIPHFNNTEGGTHDTRFCYLGERRLRVLEGQMPLGTFVLGIDEHTSVSFDLDAKTATVGGIGLLTIRKDGHATTFPTGTVLMIEQILECARGRTGARLSPVPASEAASQAASTADSIPALLLDQVQRTEVAFRAAVEGHDALNASATILELEQSIHDWSSDSPGQDEMSRARASLRAQIIEFGQAAAKGFEGPAVYLVPFVELLVELRSIARAERRFNEADEIRERLVALGIELHDTATETRWSFVDGD